MVRSNVKIAARGNTHLVLLRVFEEFADIVASQDAGLDDGEHGIADDATSRRTGTMSRMPILRWLCVCEGRWREDSRLCALCGVPLLWTGPRT